MQSVLLIYMCVFVRVRVFILYLFFLSTLSLSKAALGHALAIVQLAAAGRVEQVLQPRPKFAHLRTA